MNAILRELLTDLKAAALIGHPESLQSALDGVRALDDEQLPPSVLVPLGRTLTSLPANILKPLFVDDDPAIRAVVSVALGERYMQGKDVTAQDLGIPAEDPNPEVRAALAHALIEFTPPRPEKLELLVEFWLNSPAHERMNRDSSTMSASQQRVIHLALLLLPFLPSSPLHLFINADTVEDHDFREALVACLNTIAEKGQAAPILDLLSQWASHPAPNVWVITRILSAAWTQNYRDQATRTLNTLSQQVGMIRPIVRALEKHS